MSPFPLEAIDEVIWRIDEATGSPESKGLLNRGWIKNARPAEVVRFLDTLRDRVSNIKYTLTNKEHQQRLREDGCEADLVVLKKGE